MMITNPYTRRSIDYPIDLSDNNIVVNYYITHETCFCEWHTTWLVLQLCNGDHIYIPYGEKNRRDIYLVTSYFLNKELSFPHGIYKLKYNEFFKEKPIEMYIS